MEQQQTTSYWEGCLYVLVGIGALIAVSVAMLGEWLILAFAVIVSLGILALSIWGMTAFFTWLWRKIALTRLEIDQKKQDMVIQAVTVRHALAIEEKRTNLVYAMDGFLPVSYDQVLNSANNGRLLDLASQRIDTLKLPENVPNHYHVVTNTETDQTLNQGANVPSITGNMGALDFLLPGSSEGKYRLIEDSDNDE